MTSKLWPKYRSIWVLLLLLVCSTVGVAIAQDARVVNEPSFPPSCVVLSGQLMRQGAGLGWAFDNSSDTSRIQQALNQCEDGQAVELAQSESGNAFVAGRLEIPAGVTLLVDAGVTLFASVNARDYDATPGSCGKPMTAGGACMSWLTAVGEGSGLMGYGVVDGRGGQIVHASGSSGSWWSLAAQRFTNPTLLQVSGADFSLYKITLQNAPGRTVVAQGNGLTAWDVKILAPYDVATADGIRLAGAQNVTIEDSFISVGGEGIALGTDPESGPAKTSEISLLHSQISAETGISVVSSVGGVSHLVTEDLRIEANPARKTTKGISLSQSESGNGSIANLSYSQLCVQNVSQPVSFSLDDSKLNSVLSAQNVSFSGIDSLTGGKFIVHGSPSAPIQISLDHLQFDGSSAADVSTANSLIRLSPATVNLKISENPSSATNVQEISDAPEIQTSSCSSASFNKTAPEMFATENPSNGALTLNALFEPIVGLSQQGPAPAPTGTVTFLDGSTALGEVTLSGGSYSASLTTAAATSSTDSYTSLYSGDANYPAQVAHIAKPMATSTTVVKLTATSTSIAYGTSVTLNAVVVSGGAVPTGDTITCSSSLVTTGPIGSPTIAASGLATFSTTTLPVGTNAITCSFAATGTYGAATSNTVTITVSLPASTTTISAAATTVYIGQSIVLTAVVTPTVAGGVTPTGTVTFYNNGTTSEGSATLNSSGVATLTIANPSFGAYNFSASYASNGVYAASVSKATTVTVTLYNTLSLLAVSVQGTAATVALVSQPFVLTDAVAFTTSGPPVPGLPIPTGTVTFYSGSAALPGCTGIALDNTGSATCNLTAQTVGSQTFTAVYSGTASFWAASTSAAVVFSTDSIAITVSPTSLSIVPGTTGQTTVTVKETGPGTITTLTLSCTSPPTIGCEFTPTAPSIPANGSGTSTLVVGVVATTGSTGGIVAFLLPLTFLLAGSRRRRLGSILAILVCSLTLGMLVGCQNNIGTPTAASTNTITITGTLGSVMQSTSMTVNIQ